MAQTKMTARQARFVSEYMRDLNATKAAVRAGYSAKTADRIGPQLLGKTCVREAVEAAQEARAARTRVTADKVIRALAAIAFADPRDYLEWDGDSVRAKDSAELTPEQSAAVADVIQTPAGTRVKLHDRLKALELLGKHLGIFTDRLQAEVTTKEEAPKVLIDFTGWTPEQITELGLQAADSVRNSERAAGGQQRTGTD